MGLYYKKRVYHLQQRNVSTNTHARSRFKLARAPVSDLVCHDQNTVDVHTELFHLRRQKYSRSGSILRSAAGVQQYVGKTTTGKESETKSAGLSVSYLPKLLTQGKAESWLGFPAIIDINNSSLASWRSQLTDYI